jgi:hypothetical protein
MHQPCFVHVVQLGVVSRLAEDTEPSQLRRALPSVEHFVFGHPDSSLLNTAVFCTYIQHTCGQESGPPI